MMQLFRILKAIQILKTIQILDTEDQKPDFFKAIS